MDVTKENCEFRVIGVARQWVIVGDLRDLPQKKSVSSCEHPCLEKHVTLKDVRKKKREGYSGGQIRDFQSGG